MFTSRLLVKFILPCALSRPQDGSSEVTGGSHGALCSNAELCAMINRDFARIVSMCRLPLSLTSLLSLPEALVLNVVSNYGL